MSQCRATAKQTGRRCGRAATDGRTVCHYHGGRAGRPPTHGRYSAAVRGRLADKVGAFLADPSPDDLGDELALLRAILAEVLERGREAGAPLADEDVRTVAALVRDIGVLVERVARILNATALTQAEVRYLVARLADILVRHVEDPDRRRAALDELRAVAGGGRDEAPEPRRRGLRLAGLDGRGGAA